MASFETRGTSTRVSVYLPGGGKKTATFDTRAEAEAWAESQERRKVSGNLNPNLGKTVRDLLEIYHDVAAKADAGRWNSLRLLKWTNDDEISRERVSDITTHRMNVWMNKRGLETYGKGLAARRISGSTVNREMNLWSAAFTYAVKSLGWIKVNPCHGAARPAEAPARNRDLMTADEIKAICAAGGYQEGEPLTTTTSRVVACFLLALETGMRSGEILRLRPRDYDKEKRTIRVSALEVGGRKGSKSGTVRSGRYVPLTDRAVEVLDQLLASMPTGQKPEAGFTGPPYIVGMDDRCRDATWRKVRDRSCVEDLTFHDTKHEACTRLSKFVDVLVLSHAIGTKDIRLLRDTYYVNDAAAVAATLPSKLAVMA